MSEQRVRPRDAASLVILRGAGDETCVLLGRREPRNRFMPNVWVFPGGRVDPADAQARPARGLRPAVAAKLEEKWSPVASRALAVAAVRETWEETGLTFGEVSGQELRPALDSLEYVARAITPSDSPIRYHARFFTARAESAAGDVRGNGELLDLEWFSIPRALELDMIDVTRFVLDEVQRRSQGEHPGGVPFIHYRGGTRRIVYE